MAGAAAAVLLHRAQQVDAAAVRQPHVEQVGVGAPRVGVRAELRHGLRQTFTCVALALQNHAQRAADILFVVHDQDAFGCHWLPRAAARGNLRRPVLLSPATMSPPESSALLRAMESPSPMPRFLKEMVG